MLLRRRNKSRRTDQKAEDQHDREQRRAREGRAHHQKFAHEDAERRQAGDRDDAQHQTPAEHRMGLGQAADIGDPLRAFDLRDMADGEEDRRFGQAVHRHVQQPGEIGQRAAHAEGEHDDAHVLDRGIGEQALDVAAAVEHERCEHERDQAQRHHQRAGRERAGIGRQQHLEAQQRIERDIQQQARQHGRDRRRTFGMGVGQPGMQRRQADLGAVAEQQEDEGDIEKRRIESAGALDQDGPDHGVQALADHRPRRHVDQDGAEQRERDADAAENEIFPCRFERFVGAIDADHQHRGQRRHLDRHPHQADIVGDEREVHGEHQDLIHGVIETQKGGVSRPVSSSWAM